MIEVVYGHKVTSADDAHLKLADRSIELVGEIGNIGGTIIDFFPFCKYELLKIHML